MKYQKWVLAIILSALCAITTFSQKSLFEKYRFEDGGYTLAGIFAHHSDHPIQKKVGEFYTDEIAVLNGIKKAWVFTEPQNQHACGYHYYFLVLKDGEEIDSFPVNLECKELVTANGSVYFDGKRLEMIASKLKPLRKEKQEFSSAAEARAFLTKVKKEQGFIYAWPPRWVEFEGEFRFGTKCPAELGNNCYYTEHETELVSRLRKEISQKFPGEVFELKAGGGSSNGDAFVIVKSNKSLEEKFDLYDRWNRTGFGKWEPYHLSLNWYSKKSR
jgi:hypothetical protein